MGKIAAGRGQGRKRVSAGAVAGGGVLSGARAQTEPPGGGAAGNGQTGGNPTSVRCLEVPPEKAAALAKLLGPGPGAADGQLWVPVAVVWGAAVAGSGGRPAVRYLFRQAGAMCEVVFEGQPSFFFPNTDGAKYLDHLFHHPGQPIRAFELEVNILTDRGQARAPNTDQEVADEQAKREAREELPELARELAQAEAEGLTDTAARLRAEITQVSELAGEEGLLDAPTHARARVNVTRAIARVVRYLRQAGPELQPFCRHIMEFILTGNEVVYNQPADTFWA